LELKLDELGKNLETAFWPGIHAKYTTYDTGYDTHGCGKLSRGDQKIMENENRKPVELAAKELLDLARARGIDFYALLDAIFYDTDPEVRAILTKYEKLEPELGPACFAAARCDLRKN